MPRYFRSVGPLFLGLLFAIALTVMSGAASAFADCDTTGTHDGSATPTTVLPGQVVSFVGTGFGSGEHVSFWFTLPSGDVFGTASPLCCAGGDGTVRLQPQPLPDAFYQFEGRWALTFEGASTHHQAVIYFCVFRTAPTAVPPTATPVPPTATTAAATATTAPATETPAPAATETTAPAATATTAPAATETPVPVATATEVPTAVPVVPTVEVPPAATETPVVVGMPSTGAGDDSMLTWTAALVVLASALLILGLVARRRSNVIN